MSTQIRYPSITANDPEGKLRQIQSYLYQLADQLNVALRVLEQTAQKDAAKGE